MILPVEYPGGSYDIVLERGALARAADQAQAVRPLLEMK